MGVVLGEVGLKCGYYTCDSWRGPLGDDDVEVLGGLSSSPTPPLQTARELLELLAGQIRQAELVLDVFPLGALDALKNIEERVRQTRKALASAILGETPRGARRVLLHVRRGKARI